MAREQTLEGGGLRVTFTRLADRFGHAVALLDGDTVTPLLESIEGQPDDPWPPTPPLQELHIEQHPGGVQVALLVGRAGGSHWSASIALDPQAGRVEFDFACRAREQPGSLGAAYRLLQSIDQQTVALARWEDHAARLEALTWGDATVQCSTETPGHLEIVVAPQPGAWPRTVRWGHAVERSAR